MPSGHGALRRMTEDEVVYPGWPKEPGAPVKNVKANLALGEETLDEIMEYARKRTEHPVVTMAWIIESWVWMAQNGYLEAIVEQVDKDIAEAMQND